MNSYTLSPYMPCKSSGDASVSGTDMAPLNWWVSTGKVCDSRQPCQDVWYKLHAVFFFSITLWVRKTSVIHTFKNLSLRKILSYCSGFLTKNLFTSSHIVWSLHYKWSIFQLNKHIFFCSTMRNKNSFKLFRNLSGN